MRLTILYRGPLSSCNYDCHYCPFAKQHDSKAELLADEAALAKFVEWCRGSRLEQLSVFFTPWGEALTRRWYWNAIEELTHFPFVNKVAIQTNLSCGLSWLQATKLEKLGFWCTYHPSQAKSSTFLSQVAYLRELNVSHSVGMVGIKEDFDAIREMRANLPSETYLWINAFKQQSNYYDEQQLAFLSSIDPHFQTNNTYHASLGRMCNTGMDVVSIDGDGDLRRCHFVKQVRGNIYQQPLEELLSVSNCPNNVCGCHIGYIHMPHLNLHSIYGSGLLERAPQ